MYGNQYIDLTTATLRKLVSKMRMKITQPLGKHNANTNKHNYYIVLL